MTPYLRSEGAHLWIHQWDPDQKNLPPPPQTSCYLFSTPPLKRTNLHEIAAMMARPISSMNFWGNTTLHNKTQAHKKAPQLCITKHTYKHTHRSTQAALLCTNTKHTDTHKQHYWAASILPPASVTWKPGQGVSRPLQISVGGKNDLKSSGFHSTPMFDISSSG